MDYLWLLGRWIPHPGPSPHRFVLEEMKGTGSSPLLVPSQFLWGGARCEGWMEDLGILDFPFSAGLRTRGSCAKSHGVVVLPRIYQHRTGTGTTRQLAGSALFTLQSTQSAPGVTRHCLQLHTQMNSECQLGWLIQGML